MRARLFSSALAVVFAMGFLLPIHPETKQASSGTEATPGQTDSQATSVSTEPQPDSSRSEDAASQGRINVTVGSQDGEKASIEAPSPKGRGWIPWLVSVIFSWPFLVAVLAVFLLAKPGYVHNILIPFQSFKFFGAEFVLDRRSGSTAEAAIQIYRNAVQEKFDEIVKTERIAVKHKKLVEALQKATLTDIAFRSTIYVPDMLLDESLYQLLDYHPPDGGKRGRVFSARYGMIGRCWRLEKSDVKGSVSTFEETLVDEWGMDRTEAREAARGRQSFACVILKNTDQVCLGLFYMDSQKPWVFDSKWNELEPLVRSEANNIGLIAALQKVHTDLIASSARVRIYKR